jgi:hypothetical protein
MKYTYITAFFLVIVALSIPVFIDYEATITGMFSVVDVAPGGFSFEEPNSVTQLEASESLKEAEEKVELMKKLNFSTIYVDDALFEARQSYERLDYFDVMKVTSLIFFVYNEHNLILDKLELIKIDMLEAKRKKVPIESIERLLSEVEVAIANERYDEANDLLRQSDLALTEAIKEKSRLKNIAFLGRNFIFRYWWQLLIIFTIIGGISRPVFIKIQKKRLKTKIATLKVEYTKTKELIKKLQTRCFVDKKITTDSYKTKSAKYEERIAEIKHTLPVLEAQLKGRKSVRKKKIKGIIEVKR